MTAQFERDINLQLLFDERDPIIDDRQILLESEAEQEQLGFNNFESIFSQEVPNKMIFELQKKDENLKSSSPSKPKSPFPAKELFNNDYRT